MKRRFPESREKGSLKAWLILALRPDVARRGTKVALIVGTIVTLINQGDVLFSGALTTATLGKIMLTYCVPYCVSTYAGVAAIRNQQKAPQE